MAQFRVLVLFFLSIITVVSSQAIITPPPPSNHPVEANGKLYFLYYVPEKCIEPRIVSSPAGVGGAAVIKDKQVLMEKYGPYIIQGNIEIAPSGCLVIMPGTVLYFSPGYGIIVNGTLIARGSLVKRIKMTKNPNATAAIGPSTPWPTDARLVDGNTTRDGRLDLLYNGKWRGVCTNYQNFTAVDLNVTCRHLGFVYGNFTYHSFTRNETDYMLYEKPACLGNENSILECPGKTSIKYGARVCDGQQVVGFECAGLRPDLAKDHWRGIEFYNATVGKVQTETNVFFSQSLSFLEYVDISYAGLDIYKVDGHHHGRASISASPYVPLMNNITVTHGAYDGFNMTEIRGEILIANSTVSHNRGHGFFIQSAVGRTLINMTDVTDNWGDGIKMYLTNYTINKFNRNFATDYSFCRTAYSQLTMFPTLQHEDLVDEYGQKPDGRVCGKRFKTEEGKMITLHILMMERDPSASGTITVYDGPTHREGTVILKFDINNGTFPQSVTTKTNEMWIYMDYLVPRKPPEGVDPTTRCKHLRGCIRFLMELTTNEGPDIELRVYNTSVIHNNGYGVNIQDVRSKVALNSSVVTDNNYGAGVRVYQGAAEVAINNTIVKRNMHSGVNITYSGGYQLFNMSTISENYGYGVITEYLRLNRTRYEIMQLMEVVKSSFTLNQWTAFRIGNYCLGGEYLFNQSYFGFNKHEAIEYLSCNISTSVNTNFSVAYSTFESNARHGILISPVVNTVGIITNNTFMNHSVGVIRIDNGYDFIENRWYKDFDVNYRIYENDFSDNKGTYVVNFRLSQPGPKHKLQFKFNKLVDNVIKDTFQYLTPRSKANAVIVASSGNVEVQRNYIYNPESVRDIATHLVDPSVIILANLNWWQTQDHSIIYPRLFDQNDRYNLAELKYHPVLKDQWLYSDYDTSLDPEYRWSFHRGVFIGGVLDGMFKSDQRIKRYIVDRDIVILKDSVMEILPGTTLEFHSSIGMVVHGRLIADGAKNFANVQPITMKLYEDDILPLENRTIYEKVRLVDGVNELEGRLEINMTGEFGTVCNDGWTDQNSALVCQQLGLTFNPMYGRPAQITYGSVQEILLSRVGCDELDTDLFDCMADQVGEFQCDHAQDVFIRCQSPTWSGVTIPAMPRYGQPFETQIRHLIIDKAGLLDFAEMTYTPGLRIDYNFYAISYLTVKNCVSDGVNVKYSNPYSRNLIEHLTLTNNLGNGLLTRSSFLQLSHVTMLNNDKAGFIYDPMFTEYEALSVRNFIERTRKVSILDTPSILLGNDEMKFLVCPSSTGEEDKTYWVEVNVSNYFRITVQVLDYSPLTNVEKVVIYESRRADVSSAARFWRIEEDLVNFPIVSRSTAITIKFTVRGLRSGRLALAIISNGYTVAYNSQIRMFNATIKYNERGIVTKHYNNPSNEKLEIFHRNKNEFIEFDSILVEGSRKEAMFIPSLTKYHENFIPTFEEMTQPEKVGSVTYKIIHAKFINNEKGIHGEHNHVDFANNVWKWNVSYVEISGCNSGGFEIELPRVNDLFERQYHEVLFTQSKCYNNKRFAFGVLGYYANVTISHNNLYDNNALRGLITLSGMEKDLNVDSNRMENNYCKYVVDFDLKSHSEYSEKVNGIFQYNVLINNRNNFYSSEIGIANTPTTYTLAFRGVQNITAYRNVLDNADLQYELVAGITALNLENTLNVKGNYWGTTDQYKIKERIFDFDDWNNFAIAEYFPFLSIPNIGGDLSNDQAINQDLDLNHLGGRIWQDLTIPSRGMPYIVYSDLTIMPNVKFTIPPGTELQFYPNVGILVLGQLIAAGVPTSRIKFGPVQPQGRFRRGLPSALTSSNIRFIGGKTENEGFLELYNATSRTWNLMCDNQFNEKTAEAVCRELGLETVNVDVRFTHLYDYLVYGEPKYFIKEFWAYSYYCAGDEKSLDLCMKRINYNIKSCIFAANYTFIRCGPRNLPQPLTYWGNLRFAQPNYEEEIVAFIRDEDRSILQYVDVDGAGMLHGEKVGAIQTTYVSPIMSNVNITRCVSNGIDVVAPRHSIEVVNHNISGNLGYAINMLVLNGDSTTSQLSSFIPLSINTVPYNLYGLVDICRMEKEIILENRLILFYKYSQSPVDCVKIIRGLSSIGTKKVALRFLQFNLYYDDFYRNSIEIFDGKDITNQHYTLLANSSSDEVKTRYTSTNEYLTIHIHASPAYGYYGFIAEVVTIPLSGLTYPDDSYYHNVRHVIMKGNQDGAILYKNVGEITPSLIVDHCWIEGNGVGILNLTSPPVIDVGLQSTKQFNFQNSYVAKNNGGMYVTATTPSAATKLRANLTNNVFAFGRHGEALNLTGHHYEKFFIYENYFYNNTAGDYRDVIHVQHVVVNFTFNTITNNTGHYVVRLYNTEQMEATQEYTKNLFHNNNATALYRSLFHVGSGNPKITNNYMVNPECDFEMETNPVLILDSGLPGYNAPIDARNNWWGSESTSYVNGKVWDKLDNESLVAVDYMPVKITNESLIYGKCAPGWYRDSERCYKYFGAALPYKEANQFCEENNGFLAEVKGRQEFFKYLLRLTMNVYDPGKRVWVYSDVTGGRCSAFESNTVVEEYDCYYVMHPFICEKDPYISAPGSSIYAAVIGIAAGVFGLAVIVIIVLAALWWVKSRRRSREKFERAESIRGSMRGSTIRSRSTMSMFTDTASKRRLDMASVSSSKYGYDDRSMAASQMSLDGVTEDETTTDPAEMRRRLRQRAEIARGRPEPDAARYDRFNERNGHAGGRQRAREPSDVSDDEGGFEKRRNHRSPAKHHSNGGYKYSDESHGYSDKDSEYDDEKKPYDDDEFDDYEDEEDTTRNSFTPVKFKPNVEKEQDSIRMQSNGSVQFLKQDDTGSVDMSGKGRQLSRSMSSFSQPDSGPGTPTKSNSQNSDLDTRDQRGPTPPPPPPLPLNIPNKFDSPMKSNLPAVRPVPAPRPKPIPSARSYGSREDLASDNENKLNNLSQDELSDTRGSRDRIDEAGFAPSKRAPSRENLNYGNEPYKHALRKSQENLSGSRGNIAELGVGVDFLPRDKSNGFSYEGDRENHTSRENLLPKKSNNDDYMNPDDRPQRIDEHMYKPKLYQPDMGNSREKLVPRYGVDPGVEYMGRATPQNTDYSDGTGVDYLPRNNRFGPGSQSSTSQASLPPPPSAGYQPAPAFDYSSSGYHDSPPPPPVPGYQYPSTGYHPGPPPPSAGYQNELGYSPHPDDRYNNYSAESPGHSGVDFMPRRVNNYDPSKRYMSNSRENLSKSRENISRSRENLSRSRENLSRSRDNLRGENDYTPSRGNNSYNNGAIRDNSTDVKKPKLQKSIETEI